MFALLSLRSHLLKLDRNSIIYPFNLLQIHTQEISFPKKSLKNPIFYNYLIDAFNFPEERAIKVSNRLGKIKTLERPQSVVNFLKSFGFSHSQIQSAVNCFPCILVTNTDKILGPKLRFFQELGLSGSDLGKFVANNSSILTYSLEDTLKPCIANVQNVIGNDDSNKELIRVLSRCNYVLNRNSNARILSNVSYLKSCGIHDDQLSKLFKIAPRLFTQPESEIKSIVGRASDIGFPTGSRMLVHAIFTVSSLGTVTWERKLDLIRSFGFSKDECIDMLRRAPALLRASETKLSFALDFLLHSAKVKRSAIVAWPTCLMYNTDNRLVARYRVVKTLMMKGLLKKEPALLHVVPLPEKVFLEKYISKFSDNAAELMLTYKSHLPDSSKEEV